MKHLKMLHEALMNPFKRRQECIYMLSNKPYETLMKPIERLYAAL